MIAFSRIGARLLAGALLLTLLPTFARAQDNAQPPHPWKLAYAKRMSEERFEHREAREKRDRELRRRARELKAGKKRAPGRGDRLRPARPEDMPASVTEPTLAPRHSSRFSANVFSTPANHIINNRTSDISTAGQSEMAMVAVGDRLIAAWNDGQGFQSFGDTQGWASSADGGVTWTDRGDLPHATGVTGFRWTSDPVLTVNEKSGAVYFAALCDFNNANGTRSGVGIVKGRWNGTTFAWGTPVIARDVSDLSDFIDKEWIVADSVSNRVYLTYTRFPSDLSMIEFMSADSGLTTFSTPQRISLNTATENGFVQGSRAVVDGDGRVYVMYYLIGQNEEDFFKVLRSDNGGATFTAPAIAATFYSNFGTGSPGFNRDQGVQFASIACDRSHGPDRGRVYLTWPESINWLDDVGTIGQNGAKSEIEGNNTALTATAVTAGQSVRGTVSSATDVDFYAIPLAAGQHFLAAADSVQSGSLLALRLLAPDGQTRLTFTTFDATANANTQNPQGAPTGWLFTAPSTDTYYLQVLSAPGLGSSGAYRLRTGFADVGTERGRDQRDVFMAHSDDGLTWSTPVSVSDEPSDPVGYDAFLPEIAVAPDGGVYCAWHDYRDAAPSTTGGEAGVYLARSGDGGNTWTKLGAMADTLTNWSRAVSNLEPNQGDYMALFVNTSSVWVSWGDGRRGNPDGFMAATPLIPNGAQVAFQRLALGFNRIQMEWNALPADTISMRLYRSTDGGAYVNIDVVTFDGTGALAYTDTTVTGDHIYAYRLGRFTNGIELFFGQVRLFLPSTFPISMSAPRPNPVVGSSFTASFSIPESGPADLILHDITGREVFRQTVNLGKGPHTITLPAGSELKQGIYVLTLRQGGRNASTRVHLVR